MNISTNVNMCLTYLNPFQSKHIQKEKRHRAMYALMYEEG